jgi:hypothetical protein
MTFNFFYIILIPFMVSENDFFISFLPVGLSLWRENRIQIRAQTMLTMLNYYPGANAAVSSVQNQASENPRI